MIDILANAGGSGSIWVLGSLVVVCFGSIIGLYTWVGNQLGRQDDKYVSKEVCCEIHTNLKEGQKTICKKVDKLIEHLIDDNENS